MLDGPLSVPRMLSPPFRAQKSSRFDASLSFSQVLHLSTAYDLGAKLTFEAYNHFQTHKKDIIKVTLDHIEEREAP